MEEEHIGPYKKAIKLVKNDVLGGQSATLTEGSLPHAATGISISFSTLQSMANVRVRVSKIDILGQFKPNYHETYFILRLQV